MIPLSIPHIGGNEWEYIKECLDTAWVSSAGEYVDKFEEALESYTDSKHAVATMNGTAALHLALLQAGVSAGEYVLLPDITFVAPANAIRYCGADPLLIDIDPDTWQIDLELLEEFLEQETDPHPDGGRLFRKENKRVRVLLAVHVLGVMADMNRMVDLAERFDLLLIEDASEALGSRWDRRSAGTYGDMGVFSFNGNKIITTGGGGMMVTDEQSHAEEARHLSTQAKTDPEQYIHDAVGYNYRLVNILAALGLAQMEQLPDFIEKKRSIDARYREALSGVGDIDLQELQDPLEPNCWLFTIRTNRKEALIDFLSKREIQCRPLWVPMHQLEMYQDQPYIQSGDHASTVHQEAVCIPSSAGLTESDQHAVIDAILAFFDHPHHSHTS